MNKGKEEERQIKGKEIREVQDQQGGGDGDEAPATNSKSKKETFSKNEGGDSLVETELEKTNPDTTEEKICVVQNLQGRGGGDEPLLQRQIWR